MRESIPFDRWKVLDMGKGMSEELEDEAGNTD